MAKTEQFRLEPRGEIDRRRAVGPADDPDARGRLEIEPQEGGEYKGHKYPDLGRRAKEEAHRIRDEGAKIGHRAYTEKNQRRIDAELDSLVHIVNESARLIAQRPVRDAGDRQIGEQHAEGDGNQQ